MRNSDTSVTQAFTMKATTKTIQLGPGRYHIRIERSGETKERDVQLVGTEGQLTYSVEFKNEE